MHNGMADDSIDGKPLHGKYINIDVNDQIFVIYQFINYKESLFSQSKIENCVYEPLPEYGRGHTLNGTLDFLTADNRYYVMRSFFP